MATTIGIVGVGNMGSAIARGFARSEGDYSLVVYDRSQEAVEALVEESEALEKREAVEELIQDTDVVVVAVKPQDMAPVLSALSDTAGEDTVVISVAAGVSLERLRVGVGPRPYVYRAMPNLAVALGEGVIALSTEGSVSQEHVDETRDMLSVLGAVAVIPERQFNAVTALSASGPGMLSVVLDAMEDAGVCVGLSRQVSRLFVQQMALGTAHTLLAEEISAAELKNRVASPGGTTIAGIAVLETAAVRGAFIEAVRAAEARGREL